MALPSQVERSNENSRPVMARGNRPGPSKRMLGGIGLGVLAVCAVVLYKMLPESTPKAATAAEETKNPRTAATPAPHSIAPETPPAPQPPADNALVLSQGRTPDVGTFDPTKPKPVDVTGGSTGGGNPSGMAPGGTPPTTPNTTPGTAGGSGTPPNGPVPSLTPGTTATGVRALMEAGDKAMATNNLVAARVSYSKALMSIETAPADQEVLRQKLMTINDDLVFSPRIVAGDPLVESYTVVSGDNLVRIRKNRDLATDSKLIARINRLSNPNNLKIGQHLKLLRGPFSVVVHKADFRLDLFAGSPDDSESWLYIRSFKVGIGADNGTPLGTFVVKNKMTNPDWRNPKTGEKFDKDDPKNPIGEFWLGWEGLGDSKVYTGFGLHGTIDPTSIGQAKSMGCVRMGNEDIALIYELLVERISQIRVLPN